MNTHDGLDIAKVAKLTGLPASTLRYYEEKGLIKSIGRDGLKRVFSVSVLDQLSLISLGRYAGFSLDEIRAMFSPDGKPKVDRTELLKKADALGEVIRQLEIMRKTIVHVANCPKPSQLECARFQTLVKSAARRQLKEKLQKTRAKPGWP